MLPKHVLLALTIACAEPEPEPVVEPPPADPLAWDYDATVASVPVQSAAAITARLQQAVLLARSFDSGPIVAAYDVAMREQAPGCPQYLGFGEFRYWYDDCVTPAGHHFDGYTFFAPSLDNVDYQREGIALWGASSITLADGRVFHLGGRVEKDYSVGQGQSVWLSRVTGTFRWDGEEADGTWLGEGYALDLEMVGNTLVDESGGRAIQLHGGIDGFADPLGAVRFEGLNLTDRPGGDAELGCAPEPSGGIAVRDDAGRWYDLTLDGADAEAAAEDRCDGCGIVTLLGEPLYEVCLDFSALTAWDDVAGPW